MYAVKKVGSGEMSFQMEKVEKDYKIIGKDMKLSPNFGLFQPFDWFKMSQCFFLLKSKMKKTFLQFYLNSTCPFIIPGTINTISNLTECL